MSDCLIEYQIIKSGFLLANVCHFVFKHDDKKSLFNLKN